MRPNQPWQSIRLFFFQAEDGIRYVAVTGVQTCALPISWCATGAQLQRQEIREELLAGVGEDRFRVELNAFDLVAAVAQAPDNAGIGFRGDRELARQRLPFPNERGIAGGRERGGQRGEEIFPLLMNLGGFPLENVRSAG